MANPTPRKFQEKIALLHQKGEAGTAEFEKIMTEVKGIKENNSVVRDLETLRQQVCHGTSSHSGSAVVHHHAQMLSPPHYRTDFSPSPNHLSPPLDTLSRSNSDSSIHQAYQTKMIGHISRKSERANHYLGVGYINHPRPKSLCDMSGQSDIVTLKTAGHSAPSALPSTVGTRTGSGGGPGGGVLDGGGGLLANSLSNTSSLPDLTQVLYHQFSAAYPHDPNLRLGANPNDQQLGVVQSTGTQTMGVNGLYSMGNTVSRGTSPGPSPSPIRKTKSTSPYPQPISRSSQHCQNKSFLHVPDVKECYLHCNMGYVVDNVQACVDPYKANGGRTIYGQPLSPGGSHPTSPNPMPFMDYRNPVSPQLSRSNSPVSPALNPNTSPGSGGLYRSSSPDSRSAPPSPGTLHQTSPSPVSSPGVSTQTRPFLYDTVVPTQLNEQFEQINMIDTIPGSTSTGTYTTLKSPTHIQTSQMTINLDSGGSGYFSNTNSSSPNTGTPTCPPPPYPSSSLPSSQPQVPIPPSSLPFIPSPGAPPISPLSPDQQALSAPPQTPTTIPSIIIEDPAGMYAPDQDILPELSFADLDPATANELLMQMGPLPNADITMGNDNQFLVDNEVEEGFRRDHQAVPQDQFIPSSVPLVQVPLSQHSYQSAPVDMGIVTAPTSGSPAFSEL